VAEDHADSPATPAERLLRRSLAQPDRRSCGAACVVVAGMLSRAEPEPPAPTTFREQVLATHRRLTGPLDARGRVQLPWPRALGTPPWAVARELAALTGLRYRVRWVRTRREAVGSLDDAHAGSPIALYVGNRWLPRHVVLVVGATRDGLRTYEPTSGRLVTVSRATVTSRRLRLAGWDVPWFSVRPAARRTSA
jgi:hypothetical protein